VKKTKPNILLITTDQQRFDTIQALGNKHIYTPHLNWLLDEGINFNRCYTDCPMCIPARATIMTGKHAYTHGLTRNSSATLPLKDNVTLPEILTQNGYQTRAQGKMHFHPMRANYGFEHMELPMEYYRERHRNASSGLPKEHGVGENEIEPVISTVDEAHSLTHWTVSRSVDFLETRDETRPFFLWTSFTKPHPPFDPCANYWALYQNKDLPLPAYGDWSKNLKDTPQGFMWPTYFLNNAYRMSDEQLQDVKRAYYACITQIDYSLGLLFARMRELNLLENTWIVFTADHGDMMGDHHMAAKSVFFEGSAHIPMIVRPPSKPREEHCFRGVECNTLVSLADVMPTLLNIAGVKKDLDLDGEDLIELTKSSGKERIFYGNSSDNFFVVIEDDYKYHWTSMGGAELLFNIKDDPKEQKNLATISAHKTRLKKMRKQLFDFLNRTDNKYIKDGKLIYDSAPKGPKDVHNWPGFHSTTIPSDVLH
jgi:arylsulfatase